jgi:hypothetical protein
MPDELTSFFVAPFAIDGEPEGVGRWELDKLSPKWLAMCDQYLELHGTSFDLPWPDGLSHIRTKFTSASGTALVNF